MNDFNINPGKVEVSDFEGVSDIRYKFIEAKCDEYDSFL